jgi:hypothetical protein
MLLNRSNRNHRAGSHAARSSTSAEILNKIFLITLIFAAAAALNIRAADATSLVVPEVDVYAPMIETTVPSTFTVPITVGDITDAGIFAFQFNIIYDPLVIDPIGANFGCSTEGTLAEAAGLSAVCNVTPDGTFRVAVYGALPMTGAGTIINVTFATDTAAATGNDSPLRFENVYFFNAAGAVVLRAHDGNVSLVAPVPTATPTPTLTPIPTATPMSTQTVDVYAPTASQLIGSTFFVPITVNDISDIGIFAFQFNLVYDPQLINPTGSNFGCSTEGTLAGAAGLLAVCNVLPEGTLRVAVYGASSMTGSGTILNVKFRSDGKASGASVSALTFEDVFFFNSSGLVFSDVHHGQITLTLPNTRKRKNQSF